MLTGGLEQLLEPTTAAQRILDVLLQEPERAARRAMLPGCFEAPSAEDAAQVQPKLRLTLGRFAPMMCMQDQPLHRTGEQVGALCAM